MSLQIQPGSGVPDETVRVARAAFPKGNAYMTLRDELGTIYADGLFASLFSKMGQPAETPWRLAIVTVLQFAEGLSDRRAADAVRSRIDWKYLLGLTLEDPGFNYSVLSEFRMRLIAGQMEQQLLDELLEQFRQRGLLKARGKQRTDSTHIQAAIRNTNRLELAGETLRMALDRLAVIAPQWLQAHVPLEWYERYASRFEQAHLPQTEREREGLAVQIGQDGRQLLEWVYAVDSPTEVRKHPGVEILRQIWVQQYYIQDEEVFWRKSGNMPPPERGIASPYDPEARFSTKRLTEWLGYKVHLSESCEEELPRLITQVETVCATRQDHQAVEPIHAALQAKDLLPSQHFLDMGYVETAVLADSRVKYGVEVIGPIQRDNTWQAQSEQGLDVTQFAIHWEKQQVTCPNGKLSRSWKEGLDVIHRPRIMVDFDPADCRLCPVRSRCTHSLKGARRLSFKPRFEYELLQWARQRNQTPEFKKIYAQRAGIEATISQGTRSFGLRRSRYIGRKKTHLQHVLTAIAINLIRFVNWIQEVPLAPTRSSPFVKLAPAGL